MLWAHPPSYEKLDQQDDDTYQDTLSQAYSMPDLPPIEQAAAAPAAAEYTYTRCIIIGLCFLSFLFIIILALPIVITVEARCASPPLKATTDCLIHSIVSTLVPGLIPVFVNWIPCIQRRLANDTLSWFLLPVAISIFLIPVAKYISHATCQPTIC